jgi:hypothetical protein
VTQPPIDKAAALRARARIVALGGLLTEVTAHRTADDVHRDLLDRLTEPGHDPRLDGVSSDRRYFADRWEALRQGAALPAATWETLVLPTVVAFSGVPAQKAHLERAATLWLRARSAVDAVVDYPQVMAAVIEREASRRQLPAGSLDRSPTTAGSDAGSRARAAGSAQFGQIVARSRLIRLLVLGAAAVAVMVAAVIVLQRGSPLADDRPPLTPATQPSGLRLSHPVSPLVGPRFTAPPAHPAGR